MKKFFAMAAIASLMLTSCSDDDNNDVGNPSANTILLTKTVETDYLGDQYVSNYFYEGTKLVKITHNDGGEDIFTYSGDKLTTIEYSENGELVQKDQFTYNSNGQLTTFVMLDYELEWGDKTVFTYNNDGTVSIADYIGDLTSQETLSNNDIFTVQNNNIISIQGEGETITYSFDDKHNPFSNITSYMSVVYAYQEGGVNNITTYTGSEENSTTTYTYNSAGFPTNSVETFGSGETYTTVYTYNQ